MVLPYNPGVIPSLPAPSAGTRITIELPGLPPDKDTSRSIRNSRHPRHQSFLDLRAAAISAMAGRAWSFGAVGVDLTIHSPEPPGNSYLNEYVGGILDTLDGSAGRHFTYLPVLFQDDCQVCELASKWVKDDDTWYRLVVTFLE